MQSAAYASQEQVCRNMSATFLILSEEDKFHQVAPSLEHIVYNVTPRQQDSSFATALASVISEHSEGLAALQLGTVHLHKNVSECLDTCMTIQTHRPCHCHCPQQHVCRPEQLLSKCHTS